MLGRKAKSMSSVGAERRSQGTVERPNCTSVQKRVAGVEAMNLGKCQREHPKRRGIDVGAKLHGTRR